MRSFQLTVVASLAALAVVAARSSGAAEATSRAAVYQALQDERVARGLPVLSVDPALEDAAQSLAEALARAVEARGAAPGTLPRLPGRLEAVLAEAGYHADRVEAMHVMAGETLRSTLFEALGAPSSFRSALHATEMTDLGVGAATAGDRPVYVLLLALSRGEAFARRTTALADLREVRSELLQGVNAARRAEGLRELAPSRCLEEVAQAFAERQLAEGFLDHVSPEGERLVDRLASAGCRMREAAENLASGPVSAEEAVAGWLTSPSHSRSLLTASFREVGHGIALGRSGEIYQVIWVQILGRP